MGDRHTIAEVVGEDLNGARKPLNVFFENDSVVILMFHDGVEALVDLARLVKFDKTVLVILTCSWYVSKHRAGFFRKILRQVAEAGNPAVSHKNIMIVANSDIERKHVEEEINGIRVILANNSASIDEKIFVIGGNKKVADAVLNAKVNTFKRHELSKLVESKIFISYGTPETAGNQGKQSDLSALKPKQLFWNLDPSKVVGVLGSCRVGMMLSAEEGACYASLEYLLCGLPVVSTESVGGRSEFYRPNNSIIVDADPLSVKTGVENAVAKLRNGVFAPEEIRATAVAKMASIRSGFMAEIDKYFLACGLPTLEDDIVLRNIRAGSKFSGTRNFWLKRIVPVDKQ